MTCSDCEKQHSDAAPACPHCGRPNLVAPVLAAVPLPEGRYPQAPIGPRLGCPACGSPEVRKLSLVYREGTLRVDGRTGGPGFGSADVTFGQRISGTSRSLLSLAAAPPAAKDYGPLAALGIALGLILFTLGQVSDGIAVYLFNLLGLIALAVVAVAAAKVAQWNREEFPRLHAQWNATFLCTRCENRFIP